jgi:hypothetical protein
LEETVTSQTRGFVPVTGSVKGIDATGCRALADYNNGMAQAFARTAAAKCTRVNAINPYLIDLAIPRFLRASADAEKGASAVPLRRLLP